MKLERQLHALSQVTSEEITRYALTHVHVKSDKTTLLMESSDGKRLLRVSRVLKSDESKEGIDILVPRNLWGHSLKRVKNGGREKESVAELKTKGKNFEIVVQRGMDEGEERYIGKGVEHTTFPDIDKTLKTGRKNLSAHVRVQPKLLADTLLAIHEILKANETFPSVGIKMSTKGQGMLIYSEHANSKPGDLKVECLLMPILIKEKAKKK